MIETEYKETQPYSTINETKIHTNEKSYLIFHIDTQIYVNTIKTGYFTNPEKRVNKS